MNHDSDSSDNDLPQDEQISQAYQSLNKEATPSALDEQILAAARREVSARPQQVSFARRWAVPVSVAAVIVLSVSLFTMHQAPLQVSPTSAPAPASIEPMAVPPMEEQAVRSDSVETKQELLMKQRSAAKPDIPEADIQADPDTAASSRKMYEAEPVLEKEKTMAPAAGFSADAVVIEEQLATIRQLLKEGKQEEATSALKTFQQRYPDYPLSEDLKKLVEN